MNKDKTKYALVTGASRGIGRATAIELAKDGYKILINYNSNEKAAQETLSLIKEAGSDGEIMQFDVAKASEVAVLEKWIDANPDSVIEILVNNAGIRKDQLLMFMSQEEWDSVLNIGLGGFYNVTKLVIKGMLLQKYGRIVNVVSLSGLKGMPGQTNYSASKATR